MGWALAAASLAARGQEMGIPPETLGRCMALPTLDFNSGRLQL